MTLANDALQYALEQYDRPDFEAAVRRRMQRALFELHGVSLFARDLVVSSPVAATTSPQAITKPSNYRYLSRVIAYGVDGSQLPHDYPQREVVNHVDHFQHYSARGYVDRGSEIIVTYNESSPASFALEYYKFPTFTVVDDVPDTDSWIVTIDYTILALKLCAQVALLIGKREDVNGWEQQALAALDAISGA